MKKTLTRDEYLKCLGLWYLARDAAKDADRFDKLLNEALGSSAGSHASDSIWEVDKGDTLDAALERMGIEVVGHPDFEE